MIARCYAMTAADDRAAELGSALLALAARVRPLPGALRVDVLREQKATATYLFIETWETADAAAAGGKALGREAFAPVMAVLATPPITTQYDVL